MPAKKVELELEMLHNLDESYVFTDGDIEVVILKSLIISLDEMEDGLCSITLPEWLAADKGLI